MQTAEKTSDGSRIVRTMRRDDLESACSILVDQGLWSGEGLLQRLSRTLEMANADYLVTEEDGAIVGVTLSVFDGFSRFVSYMAVASGTGGLRSRKSTGRRSRP